MRPSTHDLVALLKDLEPQLRPGVVAFCPLPSDAPRDADLAAIPWIALVREEEGLTAVVSEETAASHGWAVSFRARQITLRVYSDLEAVGLTAAVAQALATAGISCNVIAAVNHDHLFVPIDQADRAMTVLLELQATPNARRPTPNSQ
jgi:hypothetical protein